MKTPVNQSVKATSESRVNIMCSREELKFGMSTARAPLAPVTCGTTRPKWPFFLE
jgi:hypothetical protein